MTKNQEEQCRWTTKRGAQCRNTAVGKTGLCYRHNVTVRFRTQLIIGALTIFAGAAIAILVPEIRNIFVPERTLLERVKLEGNSASRIHDKTQMPIHAHNLYELGLQGITDRDFAAYLQAIWQLLRIHEFSWTSNWPPGPTGRLSREEVRDNLIRLITVEPLKMDHCLQVSGMLGDAAVAGTEHSVIDYNLDHFFSDNLFVESVDVMREAIDTLWSKGNREFARFVFEVMRDVILAEAHRRLDQGYRICPAATDTPQILLTGQRIADRGQPRDLDGYYRACRILSRAPQSLLEEFLASDYYYRLVVLVNVAEDIEELRCTPDDVSNWRHFNGRGMILCAVRSSAQKQVVDSLVSDCNRRRQETAACVKQLVRRERYGWMQKKN